MKTEDIDKRIGMPDVDKEWARFEQEVISKGTRRSPALAWALGIGIAASVALLLLFNIGKEQTEQAPLIAQTEEIKPQPMPLPVREEVQVKEQELVAKASTPVIAQNKRPASRNANTSATLSLDIPAREYTGAVQKFDMKEVEGLAFESVDQALQGQIAGLDVVQSSNKLVKDTTHGGIEYSKEDSFLVVVNGKTLFDSRGMTLEEIDRRIEKYLREYAEAVKKFDMKEVEGLTFESVDQALQGQIAGQDISHNEAEPELQGVIAGHEGIDPTYNDSILVLLDGKRLPDSLCTRDFIRYGIHQYLEKKGLMAKKRTNINNEQAIQQYIEKYGELARLGVVEFTSANDSANEVFILQHPELMKTFRRVEGFVVEESTNEPLESTIIRHRQFATSADPLGHFVLWVPKSVDTLYAKCIGCQDAFFQPADTTLTIRLKDNYRSHDIASVDLGSGTTMRLRGIGDNKIDSFLVVVNGKTLFDSRGMTSEETERRLEEYLNEQGLLQDIKIPWKNGAIEIYASTPEEREERQRMIANATIVPNPSYFGSNSMRLRGTGDYRPSDKDRMDSTLILVNGEPLPKHLQREVLGNNPDDLDTYVPRYFYQQHQLLDEVYVHKDSEFTEKFGERAKYGVIELKTVPDTYCDDYVKAHPKLMKKYTRMEGYVVDDNGKPLTETWVHVKWERSKLLKYPYFVGAATDSTGHYAIWLPTRDITLCAVHPGYKSVEFSPADKTLAVRLPKINKSNMNMRLRGDSQGDEIVVSVNADGNADGGHQFEKSEDDENTFCIDGIYYTVTDDGNLRVTDYDEDSFSGIATIFSVLKYQGKTMEVVDIGNEAFQRCTNLTSITIPGSVTSIGGSAFWGCSNLTSITIPESVTSIGYVAFDGCTSLTSVTIPNSVTRIAESAFSGCESLTSVTIPESVTSIEFGVFGYCSSLTSVTIPNSVIRIEGSAFRECNSLTSITIPESVTSIGWYAFYGCKSLASIIIPESVTSIGEATFKGCSSLTDVYCHAENVPETNSNAFNNSPIEKATLHVPAGSVTKYKTIAPWKNFKSIVAIE